MAYNLFVRREFVSIDIFSVAGIFHKMFKYLFYSHDIWEEII